MKKLIAIVFLITVVSMTVLTSQNEAERSKQIIMIWYPNESVEYLRPAREAVDKVIADATGCKVTDQLTTDYKVAIEAISTNKGHIGFFGAEGYIEAHRVNGNVMPLVVNSDNNGSLKEAKYTSFITVRQGHEDEYKSGNNLTIDNIQGKRFSWVSTSSTSGYKVPSAAIVEYFSKKFPKWANLRAEDLILGGGGKFFSDVLFGQSHPSSCVNLLTGKADAAAFNDINLVNYSRLACGTDGQVGAVYEIRNDAPEPFASLHGQRYLVLKAMPVLNAPLVINTGLFTKKERMKIVDALTSDTTTRNPQIFVPKESRFPGMFTAPQRFLPVEDEWFNPIRDLSK